MACRNPRLANDRDVDDTQLTVSVDASQVEVLSDQTLRFSPER